MWRSRVFFFFFFNDTATTEIYTLSLHDALPILPWEVLYADDLVLMAASQEELMEKIKQWKNGLEEKGLRRSEEHTSELQSPCNLVCRLLLEKKKKKTVTCQACRSLRRCCREMVR